MAIIVKGVGKYVPARRVLNDELPANLETSDEWIRSHTGIGARHLAADEETSATMGTAAAREALAVSGLAADDIDLIVTTTVYGEYDNFPANACLIQNALGATHAACFDIAIACTGFITASDTAAALLERHHFKYALVISAETLTRVANWEDRSTCVLFGDAAGAVVLENTAVTGTAPLSCATGTQGLASFLFGSDGSGAEALYMKHGGKLVMDGRAVYNFAVSSITKALTALMEKEGLTPDTVDYFVCHQANARILQAAAKRMHVPESKFFMDMEEFANTSSASVPVALADMVEQGLLKPGMTILVAGFGAGLSWGGGVIRW